MIRLRDTWQRACDDIQDGWQDLEGSDGADMSTELIRKLPNRPNALAMARIALEDQGSATTASGNKLAH